MRKVIFTNRHNMFMRSKVLIFPHQLFESHPALQNGTADILLFEDPLFFGDPQYPAKFHKQKLWLHRASMKHYAERLKAQGHNIKYIDYQLNTRALHLVLKESADSGVKKIIYCDPHDHAVDQRLLKSTDKLGLVGERLETPQFLNAPSINQAYRSGKKRWFMADFYKFQRKRLDILIDPTGKPVGDKWSFDENNRKKVPKKILPELPFVAPRKLEAHELEAVTYVETNWPNNPGSLTDIFYPTTHEAAQAWLQKFLTQKLVRFGDYEDAIVEGESWLWHSVLTPCLNIGLLTPNEIVGQTLQFANSNPVPLNSLEGFIRQIIGWREFMRATYDEQHVKMRTTNHWNHNRKLPQNFYDGTTGILPIDDTIQRILKTGYCHHIERLMVLGGFMFLCEIDPDDIYRWFMEMFIDSYDWVMVPNVYAMSQHADGGAITTKPYFSGSAYIKKMSHHKHGEWADFWDGLYWRWIWLHKSELRKNPRWAMMCSTAEKMDDAKINAHLAKANAFLEQL